MFYSLHVFTNRVGGKASYSVGVHARDGRILRCRTLFKTGARNSAAGDRVTRRPTDRILCRVQNASQLFTSNCMTVYTASPSQRPKQASAIAFARTFPGPSAPRVPVVPRHVDVTFFHS
jgi:hypothetical protein